AESRAGATAAGSLTDLGMPNKRPSTPPTSAAPPSRNRPRPSTFADSIALPLACAHAQMTSAMTPTSIVSRTNDPVRRRSWAASFSSLVVSSAGVRLSQSPTDAIFPLRHSAALLLEGTIVQGHYQSIVVKNLARI